MYFFHRSSPTPLWNYTAGSSITSVAISADGQYIVAGAGTPDNSIHVFNRTSSTPLWSYTTGYIASSVAISVDGQYIVAGSNDDNVYLFNITSSTPIWNYTLEDRAYIVAISADSQYIVVGSWDNNVYLFNRSSPTPLWNYTTTGDVEAVAISANGQCIIAGNNNYYGYVFGRESSTPLWTFSCGWMTYSVAVSVDGQYIVAGGWDNYVYLLHNFPPNMPTNPLPTNGATGVSINPTLIVNASDPDGDDLIVTFHNASDDSVIGTDTVFGGSGTASVDWLGLSRNTTYYWYVIVSDGSLSNQSMTWLFITRETSFDDGEEVIPSYPLMICVSVSVITIIHLIIVVRKKIR